MTRLLFFILTLFIMHSCSDPKENLTDEDVYEFMNDIIFKADSSKAKKILITRSINFTNIVKYHIWTLNISLPDKLFLSKQIDSNYYFWDCSKIPNADCIEEEILSEIFNFGHQALVTDTGLIEIDAWEKFRDLYGQRGINMYSRPIFNINKTLAIIEHSGQTDWTTGMGHIFVFQKRNSKWELLKQVMTFISEKRINAPNRKIAASFRDSATQTVVFP